MSGERIRLDGREFSVLQHMRVGGKTLLVVERLGHHRRPTYRAIERGLTMETRCVHVLPYTRANVQRLRLLKKISRPHANLPTIIESHRRGQEIILVTRWIDGPTLRQYLRDCRRGREPWPSPLVVVKLITGLVHAFRLLHDRLGVVHGDLHPDNLVLCRHAKQLVPIDFGSAWNVERGLLRCTGDGAVAAYTAPEMLTENGVPGFRSDQFSILAVAYELLTGQIPYDGLGGRAGVASQKQSIVWELSPASQRLRHSAKLPAYLQQELDGLLARGLAISAVDRFANTRELLTTLTRLSRELEGNVTALSPGSRWLLRQVERLGRVLGGRSVGEHRPTDG